MADQGCVWLFGCRSKSVGAASQWPIGCTPALSVAQKRCCSCGMQLVALYKCYMPLPFRHIVELVTLIMSSFISHQLAVACSVAKETVHSLFADVAELCRNYHQHW